MRWRLLLSYQAARCCRLRGKINQYGARKEQRCAVEPVADTLNHAITPYARLLTPLKKHAVAHGAAMISESVCASSGKMRYICTCCHRHYYGENIARSASRCASVAHAPDAYSFERCAIFCREPR